MKIVQCTECKYDQEHTLLGSGDNIVSRTEMQVTVLWKHSVNEL